ncbi:hypothetical protein CFC21_044206 [Triticum aestivum]|uniref:Uncharacterized protein n=2 Tax=Triticum aestivum TaxID=4565 RepID=A0A9R1FRC9_WHEAT|nr:hypothetical protein CFC21_044202 [Triticum aestivum]KAF7033079.1 hypothetical protein CFC21_044205 [Triticum aestivum]KAF7033080.1 hypothetical protein CFC21_044206 [Triticum aestivum]
MAEIVKSVIVGEAVSRIISGIAPTSKRLDRSVEESAEGCGLERLEMAHIKMEAVLHMSDKWQITNTSLLHWRKKLKRAAQDCDDVARRCRQLFREEEEAAQVVRQSSFPRQMAHATRVFISSLVGRDNDHCSVNSTTAAAIRRFEKLADGASEFMSFVQLGGTPRQHLFFDPLLGHVFRGKSLIYQMLHPGGRYSFFSIRPIGFDEGGLEAILSFMYEDCKVPKNNFGLVVMLRISESTDIIGTTVKCLRLLTPNFKSTADRVIREIIQLPTQDLSCVAHEGHLTDMHKLLVRWFRPDPLCCQGYEHDVVPSCHIGSDNATENKLKISSIFPEPAYGVFLWRHISVSEYSDLPRSTVVVGHDDKSSLENFPSLKLGIMFLPHDSLEDPKSDGSAVEVIDTENSHHLIDVTLPLDQLDKMLIPKATEYLHHNIKAMMYQVCWRSNHGSAHLCVEKAIAEKRPEVRRATRQGRNIKSTKGLSQVKQDWLVRLRKQAGESFRKLWVVRSSERLQSSLPHGSIGLNCTSDK